MLVLLAVLAAGRGYYLDHLPETVRSRDAAAAIYDTLLRFLVDGAHPEVCCGQHDGEGHDREGLGSG